jgi:arginyl-tRNA synthetase
VNAVQLTALIRTATADALTGLGVGTDTLTATLDEIDWAREVGRSRDPAHGEYAITVALRAGPVWRVPSRALATDLAAVLARRAEIDSAEVAGPGFVNLRLTAAVRGAVIGDVLAAGNGYGRPDGALLDAAAQAGSGAVYRALAERVGADVARYAVLRSPSGQPDPGPLGRCVDDNPAFLVRHAHARMCAQARWASELGVTPGREYGLLDHPAEVALIGTLSEFERVVSTAGRQRRPDRVARYLERLAAAVGEFEAGCRVLPMGDEPTTERHRARLALTAAVRQVLANGLGLLGVDAPERM